MTVADLLKICQDWEKKGYGALEVLACVPEGAIGCLDIDRADEDEAASEKIVKLMCN